eukprot:5878169-Amphidinium_carterae.1
MPATAAVQRRFVVRRPVTVIFAESFSAEDNKLEGGSPVFDRCKFKCRHNIGNSAGIGASCDLSRCELCKLVMTI